MYEAPCQDILTVIKANLLKSFEIRALHFISTDIQPAHYKQPVLRHTSVDINYSILLFYLPKIVRTHIHHMFCLRCCFYHHSTDIYFPSQVITKWQLLFSTNSRQNLPEVSSLSSRLISCLY